MKVLWINNVAIPRIQNINGNKDRVVYGGWLSGLSDNLLKNKEINLCICYRNSYYHTFSNGIISINN